MWERGIMSVELFARVQSWSRGVVRFASFLWDSPSFCQVDRRSQPFTCYITSDHERHLIQFGLSLSRGCACAWEKYSSNLTIVPRLSSSSAVFSLLMRKETERGEKLVILFFQLVRQTIRERRERERPDDHSRSTDTNPFDQRWSKRRSLSFVKFSSTISIWICHFFVPLVLQRKRRRKIFL